VLGSEADTLHISILQEVQPHVIMLASQDGSQAADRQHHHYMQAKMWRFDPAMTSAMNSGETRS
jgi:hypothetical protein